MTRYLESRSLAELFDIWKQQKDQDAATEIYHRYANRLYHVARKRLFSRLSKQTSPDSVANSVLMSALAEIGEHDVCFGDPDRDFWAYLVAKTQFKILSRVRYFSSAKRDPSRQVGGLEIDAISSEPGPEEATALMEIFEQALSQMSDDQRQILAICLAERKSNAEVAMQLGCSIRSVQLTLQHCRRAIDELLKD